MGTVRAIAKNTGILIAGKVLSEAVAFITIVVLARYLGAGKFGVYSLVFTYLEFFVIFADLGINLILVREISKDREKAAAYLGNAIIIKVGLSFVAMGLALLVMSQLHYPVDVHWLVGLGSVALLFSFRSVYIALFQADLRMEYPMVVSVTREVLRCLLFVCLVLLKAPIILFVAAAIVSIMAESYLLCHFASQFVRPRFTVDFSVWKHLFRESWPLALVSGLVMIYYRIDQLMLFQMKGQQPLGYYSAAVRLPEALVILPSSFMASVFPLMSRYFKTSHESLIKAYTLSFKYMMMVIIPLAAGTTLLARHIITTIYGAAYLPSVNALIILTWAEVFVYYGLIHYQIVISVNRQKLYLLFTALGAGMNVVLNLLLIPAYGIEGASIATLIAYLVSAGPIIGHLLPATRQYNMVGCRMMVKPLIASCVMAAGMYSVGPHFAFSVAAGAILYFLVMYAIRGIDRNDLVLLRSVFSQRGIQA